MGSTCHCTELSDDGGMHYTASAVCLLAVSVATRFLHGRVEETVLAGALLLSIAVVAWVWRK